MRIGQPASVFGSAVGPHQPCGTLNVQDHISQEPKAVHIRNNQLILRNKSVGEFRHQVAWDVVPALGRIQWFQPTQFRSKNSVPDVLARPVPSHTNLMAKAIRLIECTDFSITKPRHRHRRHACQGRGGECAPAILKRSLYLKSAAFSGVTRTAPVSISSGIASPAASLRTYSTPI